MRSSYTQNEYSVFFTSLSVMTKANLIVELGVLDGYSLLSFARGISKNGKVIGIDLFEDYQFKHSTVDNVLDKIYDEYLQQKIELRKKDAFAAVNDFENDSIDILHVDISNDGTNLSTIFDLWTEKVKKDGLILFEGGSEERDNVEWMKKYNKKPINDFKKELNSRGFEFITLVPFPSVTVCRKTK